MSEYLNIAFLFNHLLTHSVSMPSMKPPDHPYIILTSDREEDTGEIQIMAG